MIEAKKESSMDNKRVTVKDQRAGTVDRYLEGSRSDHWFQGWQRHYWSNDRWRRVQIFERRSRKEIYWRKLELVSSKITTTPVLTNYV